MAYKRHCLYTTVEMARGNLEVAQSKIKSHYDCPAEYRQFSPGDHVLALTPLLGSPFQGKFTGLYTVEWQVFEQKYFIATPKWRKSSCLCHVNLLKPYYSSAATVAVDSSSQSSNVSPALTATSVSVGMVTPNMMVDEEVDVRAPDDPMVCGKLKNSEMLRNLESLFIYLSLKELSLQR